LRVWGLGLGVCALLATENPKLHHLQYTLNWKCAAFNPESQWPEQEQADAEVTALGFRV